MPLYLGLDSSTQSLSAIVLEVEGARRRVAFESSILFDEAFPGYGTSHGVLPSRDPAIAASPPMLWVEALDQMMARLAQSGLDLGRLAAISGSAQQHGRVPECTCRRELDGAGSCRPSSIDGVSVSAGGAHLMDSSTPAECAEIEAAVGGGQALAQRTGSRAFERFTAAQIRKFFKQEPAAYAATDRIHLVSSFLATLLTGRHAPMDPGDGSGMNLMDLAQCQWWQPAVESTAAGLAGKLPTIAPAWTVVGTLSPYWQTRYGLPAANVVAWSGDNPCSLVGVGLVREGRLAVSLGTSDTVFGLMREPRVDRTGTGHVFGAPTGDYMGLTAQELLARPERIARVRSSCASFLDAPPDAAGNRALPVALFDGDYRRCEAGVHR